MITFILSVAQFSYIDIHIIIIYYIYVEFYWPPKQCDVKFLLMSLSCQRGETILLVAVLSAILAVGGL